MANGQRGCQPSRWCGICVGIAALTGHLASAQSPPAISAGTVLADQLLRAWIQDRSHRRKGKGLKIGEGLPATLAAIAATGLLQITMAWLKSPQNWLIHRSLEQLSSTPNP